MLKIFIDGIELIKSDDLTFNLRLTKQLTDFQTFESRKSSFSYSFEIVLNKYTEQYFKYINKKDIIDKYNKQQFSTIDVYNDSSLLISGSFKIHTITPTRVIGNIIGEEIDFKDKIGDKNMSDLILDKIRFQGFHNSFETNRYYYTYDKVNEFTILYKDIATNNLTTRALSNSILIQELLADKQYTDDIHLEIVNDGGFYTTDVNLKKQININRYVTESMPLDTVDIRLSFKLSYLFKKIFENENIKVIGEIDSSLFDSYRILTNKKTEWNWYQVCSSRVNNIASEERMDDVSGGVPEFNTNYVKQLNYTQLVYDLFSSMDKDNGIRTNMYGNDPIQTEQNPIRYKVNKTGWYKLRYRVQGIYYIQQNNFLGFQKFIADVCDGIVLTKSTSLLAESNLRNYGADPSFCYQNNDMTTMLSFDDNIISFVACLPYENRNIYLNTGNMQDYVIRKDIINEDNAVISSDYTLLVDQTFGSLHITELSYSQDIEVNLYLEDREFLYLQLYRFNAKNLYNYHTHKQLKVTNFQIDFVDDSVELTNTEYRTDEQFRLFDPAKSLPDNVNQLDFVKETLNLFNLYYKYDAKQNTIEIYKRSNFFQGRNNINLDNRLLNNTTTYTQLQAINNLTLNFTNEDDESYYAIKDEYTLHIANNAYSIDKNIDLSVFQRAAYEVITNEFNIFTPPTTLYMICVDSDDNVKKISEEKEHTYPDFDSLKIYSIDFRNDTIFVVVNNQRFQYKSFRYIANIEAKNVIKTYHSDKFTDLNRSHIIKSNIYITSEEYSKLDLSKTVYVDNEEYYINKIDGFDYRNNYNTMIELIKVV